MIYPYRGQYDYNENTVSNWNSDAIGVYYCGFLNSNGLVPMYVGLGTGQNGIKGRLLDHLRIDNWPGVTHFGFQLCDNAKEAQDWEAEEIARYKPKYNTVGK